MYSTDKEHNRAPAQGNLKFFENPSPNKKNLLFSCFYFLQYQYKYNILYHKTELLVLLGWILGICEKGKIAISNFGRLADQKW